MIDGGLHPFIASTYFSAHPLNDTHSYTLTLHPSLPASSSNSCSFLHLFLGSSQLVPPIHHTPSSTILCNLLKFSSLFFRRISNSEPLSSPPFVVFFSLLYWYPSSPALSIHSIWLRRQNTTEEWQRSGSIKRTSGLTVHTTAAPRGYVGVLLFLA